MRPPAVTVVMPVFNAAGTVGRAITSVCTQTLADWELVAIDDGSTDGTGEILAAASRADARVRVISRAHEGIVAALNIGVAAARGEMIARMDADDECHPERIAMQAEMLRMRPDLGVVGCLVEFAGARAAAGYALYVEWLNALVTPEQIALNRFVESPFAHPTVIFRRELIARLGGYRDGDFPEDYELWLRWADAGVVMAKVPRVLLTWHDDTARLSRRDPRYRTGAFFRMKAEWIAKAVHRISGERRLDTTSGRMRLLVWGAGRPTRKRASHVEAHGATIDGYIDIDAKKTGRRLAGVPVIAPSGLPPPGEALVLGYVGTRGARDLIRGALLARGYVEGRDFLMCA